jgi:hypothetical protein
MRFSAALFAKQQLETKPQLHTRQQLKPTPEPPKCTPFAHAKARLTIGSLDDSELTVVAHYNPAELAVKKDVPWVAKGEQGSPERPTSSTQDSHQFNGAPTRSMSLELLFDGYETNTSVDSIVEKLEAMTAVRDPESIDPEMRRPHFCIVVWGEGKPFRCIITSLNVRYTMFSTHGRPLRAVCSVELQEARIESVGGRNQAAGEAAKAAGRAFGAALSFFR